MLKVIYGKEEALRQELLRLARQNAVKAAGAELLDKQTTLLCGDRLRLGRNFLFGWRSGLAAAWAVTLVIPTIGTSMVSGLLQLIVQGCAVSPCTPGREDG